MMPSYRSPSNTGSMLFFIILRVVWLESPCIDDFSQDCHKGYLRERIKIMRFGGGQRPEIQEHQCTNNQHEAKENNPTNRITVIEEITVFSRVCFKLLKLFVSPPKGMSIIVGIVILWRFHGPYRIEHRHTRKGGAFV